MLCCIPKARKRVHEEDGTTPQTNRGMDTDVRVLAFDPGLRNLAVAELGPRRDPPPASTNLDAYLTPGETAAELRQRRFMWFVHHGWTLHYWTVLDVTEVLQPGGVPKVKALPTHKIAVAVADTMQDLRRRLYGGLEALPAPKRIVVESQHAANALMRSVAMSILVYFRPHFPEASLVMLSGSKKLGVCDALGVARGEGIRKETEAEVQAGHEAAIAKAEATLAKKALKLEKAQAAAAKPKSKRAKVEGGPSASVAAQEKVTKALAEHALAVTALDAVRYLATTGAAPPGRGGRGGRGWGRGRGRGGLTRMSSKARISYADNKARSVLAVVPQLVPVTHPSLLAHPGKHDDLCDVLLMGIWALWEEMQPHWPLPSRRRRAGGK